MSQRSGRARLSLFGWAVAALMADMVLSPAILHSQTSSIALLKTVSPITVTAAAQVVTYTYSITNTGDTTLTAVSATDVAFSGSGTPPVIMCPVATLAPGESTTCTATYTVTQADLDAGGIVNTATATGTPPTGPPVTSIPSTATVTATAAPGLALLKTVSPGALSGAGQVITYSFLVTNTGNTALTAVSATDVAFSGSGTPPAIMCPVATLAPQESTTCTATYTVTQADVDAGGVVNTATATGTPPTGPPVTSPESTAAVTAIAAPGLALLKTASPTTVSTAGQVVTYSFLIANTGNTTVTAVSATDVAFSGSGTPPVVTCPVTTLAPQESTTCTATYTATQADVDAGGVVNTATATGTPPAGPPVSSTPSTAVVAAIAAPGLALLKTASPTTVSVAGQVVTFSFLITNTGNTTLTAVSATDVAFSGSGTPPVIMCPVATLAPQESTTCTATYTATQADVDAGSVVNTAIANGTPPTGTVISSAPSTATVAAATTPGLTLLKTVSPITVTAAGQVVTYSFLIANTGNTTLTAVSATDTAFSGSGTPPVVTCPVTTLAPQGSTTCTATYTVTQADLDAGSIVNTATATGRSPAGTFVFSAASTAVVTSTAAPVLTLLKTASPTTVSAAGQVVTYSFLVTNTGNTTLTAVSATDTAFSGSGTPPVVTCPATTLAPQEMTTCTAAYTVTQADLDAGSIVNTATATGTPPTGPAVSSAPSSVTVVVRHHPVAVNDASLDNLPGPVTILVTANDTDVDGDLLVSTVDLDPGTAGQQTTWVAASEGSWAVDGLGNVTFTPTVGFTHDPTPISYVVSDEVGLASNAASVTVDYLPLADLSITKTGPASALTGATVTYQLTVSNGGPDEASAVVVTDPLPGGTTLAWAVPSKGSCSGTATVVCTLGPLAPSETATVSIGIQAPQGEGTLSNTATVASSGEVDPAPGNSTSAAVVTTVAEAEPIPASSGWALLVLLLALLAVGGWRLS